MSRQLQRDEWPVFIRDAHLGYIRWETYEENLQRLAANALSMGKDRLAGPPREGPALLQGLTIWGRCGQRMTLRYHYWHGRRVPSYVCQKQRIQHEQPICQVIHGVEVDAAVGDLLVESMTPLTLETTLAVQAEVEARGEEADRLRRLGIERARHEAEVAQYRYLRLDPDNRLLADALEAEWNARLRELTEAEESYERQRAACQHGLDAEQRAAILELATDVPRPAILSAFIAEHSAKGLSKTTVSNCCGVLRVFLRYAYRGGRNR